MSKVGAEIRIAFFAQSCVRAALFFTILSDFVLWHSEEGAEARSGVRCARAPEFFPCSRAAHTSLSLSPLLPSIPCVEKREKRRERKRKEKPAERDARKQGQGKGDSGKKKGRSGRRKTSSTANEDDDHDWSPSVPLSEATAAAAASPVLHSSHASLPGQPHQAGRRRTALSVGKARAQRKAPSEAIGSCTASARQAGGQAPKRQLLAQGHQQVRPRKSPGRQPRSLPVSSTVCRTDPGVRGGLCRLHSGPEDAEKWPRPGLH